MKRILALSIMLLFLGAVSAQTNCGARYQQLMEEAEKAFKDQDYRNAYEKYRAARGCKLADLAHIDRQMDASMDGIDQQRSDAQKKEEQARAATEAALRAKTRKSWLKRDWRRPRKIWRMHWQMLKKRRKKQKMKKKEQTN
ncbi:MAG: hypothetical protein IPH31_10455 [Lewinellaceae bacterium]|nr:hypothetical protein [Lewinellaceae bacterium]